MKQQHLTRREINKRRLIKKMLVGTGWRTPDTYGYECEPLPAAPGVYVLLRIDRDNGYTPIDIAYVGQARNLSTRINRAHGIYRILDRETFTQRWFKTIDDAAIRTAAELHYIARFNPPLNVRGVR